MRAFRFVCLFVVVLITKFITNRRILEFWHFFKKVKDTWIVRKGGEKERRSTNLFDDERMKSSVANCYTLAVEVASIRKESRSLMHVPSIYICMYVYRSLYIYISLNVRSLCPPVVSCCSSADVTCLEK